MHKTRALEGVKVVPQQGLCPLSVRDPLGMSDWWLRMLFYRGRSGKASFLRCPLSTKWRCADVKRRAAGRGNSKCKGPGAVGAVHRRVDCRLEGLSSFFYSLIQQWLPMCLQCAENASMERFLLWRSSVWLGKIQWRSDNWCTLLTIRLHGTWMTHLLFTKSHEIHPITFLFTDEKARHRKGRCRIWVGHTASPQRLKPKL